jgi:hypothetical protein
MWTQEEFSKKIRDQLYLLDPEISAKVGTPERKIIDAVSQALAETQFQGFIQDYQFDIETKFGQDLDDFIQMFGFARQTAKRAIGTITFKRNQSNGVAVLIPAGTQVSTVANVFSSSVTFITSVEATISENSLYATVPIEAVISGSTGNVAANTIIVSTSTLSTISEITNNTATYGGSDPESDDELKIRFKNNLFRNIAGIEDQFLALAVANQYTNRATILKSSNKFAEYVEINSGGTATSENRNAKHIYDYNYYLSDESGNEKHFYNPDLDYDFSIATSGVLKYPEIVIQSGTVPPPSGTVSVQPVNNVDGFLTSDYQYAYTYKYSDGAESALSAYSGTATIDQGSAIITNIANSSGTTSSGGTVQYKNIYRRDLLFDNTWYQVGSVTPKSTFLVNTVGRNASNLVTLYGTASTSGIEAGGTIVVTGLSGIGTALNGTHTVTSIGTTTISYTSAGTAIGTVAATGTCVANLTAFYDNNSIEDFIEPPYTRLAAGKVLFLEHEYISQWSRNVIDPTSSTSNLNKIDVYISGEDTDYATDVISGAGNLIVNNVDSKYHYRYYSRKATGGTAVIGNSVVNLMWTPVISIPTEISVNGVSYSINSDYWFVKDVTNLRDSDRCRDGIELSSAMASAVANSFYSIDYFFNKLPAMTNKVMDAHKQINQDVLVHGANFRQLLVNLEIIYNNNVNVEAINLSIFNSLNTYFNRQTFGAIIQFNDIVNIVFQTGGVENVKIATSADVAGKPYSSYYGVQELNEDGSVKTTYTNDFTLNEIDLPVLYGLGPVDKAKPIQKTKGTWVA